METTEMSIIGRRDKQIALCPYNGVLLSGKKSVTCYHMDDAQKHYAEHKTQKCTYCMIHLCRNLEKAALIYTDRKQVSGCQRLGVGV